LFIIFAKQASERYQIRNTSPAPENYLNTLLLAGEAREVFKNTFPAPEKYLYKLFRRRRSAYIHLSGAGEAWEAREAGEVFICTT